MSLFRKIWYLLGDDQRRASIVLLGLMLVGMALETLGIGLVIPLLALMSQAGLETTHPIFAIWLSSFGSTSQEWLVLAGMSALVAVYAVKTLFLAFLAWRQARFVSVIQASLSQRLFAGYLGQPYTFHLQRNSAQLIRNTISQAGSVAGSFQQSLCLLTELLVMLGISIMLLSVEPVGALLVVSTLGSAGWGFTRLSRSRILRWGDAYQFHEGLRIQYLQEGLGGAKDIKLLGREEDFLDRYYFHNVSSARIAERQATLQALPRLWLEFLAITGLAVLVLVMVVQGKALDAFIPTLGLFAAAAFRLIPSVNRVLSAVHNLRFSLPMIDTLFNEFHLMGAVTTMQSGAQLVFDKALVIDGVGFQYPCAEFPALSDISLSIPRGASVGFVGGSGAGKSTLVDVILGLLPPSSGAVKIDGVDIQTYLRGWQDQIGYVPQSIFLSDDTLRRNVAFGVPVEQIDEVAVWRAIRASQLEKFISQLPLGLDTLMGERGVRLSGGQRQRIGIARALYHDPQVLVLDEATSALDIATEHDVMEAVRALHGDKTLVIVAHRLSTVEHCDRIFRLEHGKLVEEGEAGAMLGLHKAREA